MSVAALSTTLDDQRLNSYSNKMPKQYEQTVAGVESPDSPQYHHHHHLHIQHNQEPPQLQQQQQPQQRQQQLSAEQQQRMFEEEIETLKAEQGRLVQQCADTQRREKILTRRLANKEQEFQDYVSQIAEYKAAQVPSAVALRSALLDPAVNLLFEKLKKELKATKAKLEETQNELSAWKFTPDSNTGKRLMAKCRLLYQENEELGKMTSSGRLAKLETELAMQKSFSEEVKKSQSELDDFLQELDEDVEGMQSTILFLQQELKTTRERIHVLEKENYQLKNGLTEGDTINTANDLASKSNDNEELDNVNNLETYAGINGNGNAVTTEKPITNNVDNEEEHYLHQEQQQMLHEQNDLNSKTIPITLTPIKEEPCVRVSAYTCGNIVTSNDYYNGTGSVDEQHRNLMAMQQNMDDGASGSRLLRTTTRKRAYDNSSAECSDSSIGDPKTISIMPIQQITHVAPTPRTLPPKKSKLRMTPPIAATQQNAFDLNENENLTSAGICSISSISTTITTSTVGSIAQDHTMIIDSSTATLVTNDEAGVPVATEECPSSGGGVGVAQRIMTRRRSMRTQQNGV